jgi:hypothetical protein
MAKEAVDGIFNIADHDVHPFEYLELIIFRTIVGDYWLMLTVGLSDSRKTVQAV